MKILDRRITCHKPSKANCCPLDWVEKGSNCYRAIPNLQKAIDARNECKKLGADLPVIKSTEENTFLLKLTEDRGGTWLGMYAEN
ncbi:unnamed protein product [Porites lobata]|uniref:C-type lectin domain-containing protein n=1 Tax=Porites lobata TaxID=104759 RepID=A0ABN8R9A1_9CNID|nr:unnamed protein product [Porites lobata]